jgi:N-carbamoyl-L-amino-acid hydrolase
MVLEVRCGDEAATRTFGKTLIEEVRPTLEALRLEVQAGPVSHASPTPCAPVVRDAIRAAASSLGLSSRDLPSGAGHDGVFVALTGPIGMIFVPCLDGRSHAPEESIEPHQAADGARVLFETVRRLDATLG